MEVLDTLLEGYTSWSSFVQELAATARARSPVNNVVVFIVFFFLVRNFIRKFLIVCLKQSKEGIFICGWFSVG